MNVLCEATFDILARQRVHLLISEDNSLLQETFATHAKIKKE